MNNHLTFFDKSGYIVSEGDEIVYVTDGPRVNYGVIQRIERVKPYGYEQSNGFWKITVLKTGGGYLEKPFRVTLTEPTIFKCNRPVLYQPINRSTQVQAE